jgi:hypothetical protein
VGRFELAVQGEKLCIANRAKFVRLVYTEGIMQRLLFLRISVLAPGCLFFNVPIESTAIGRQIVNL